MYNGPSGPRTTYPGLEPTVCSSSRVRASPCSHARSCPYASSLPSLVSLQSVWFDRFILQISILEHSLASLPQYRGGKENTEAAPTQQLLVDERVQSLPAELLAASRGLQAVAEAGSKARAAAFGLQHPSGQSSPFLVCFARSSVQLKILNGCMHGDLGELATIPSNT